MRHIHDLKRELVKYGEKIYEEALVIGSGGNISARLDGVVYLKASGISLKESMACDYVEIDLATGRECAFSCKPSSIELPMHIACYRARPDVGAIVHAHPVYSTVAANMVKSVGLVSYEFIHTMRSEVPVLRYIRPGSPGLGAAVRKAIKGSNAVLLKNHGIIAVGKDIKEAFFRALALERACKVLVLSRIAGAPSSVPRAELRHL